MLISKSNLVCWFILYTAHGLGHFFYSHSSEMLLFPLRKAAPAHGALLILKGQLCD